MDETKIELGVQVDLTTGECKTIMAGKISDICKLFAVAGENLIMALHNNQIEPLNDLEEAVGLAPILDFHKNRLITIISNIDIDYVSEQMNSMEKEGDHFKKNQVKDKQEFADFFVNLAEEVFRKEDENDR